MIFTIGYGFYALVAESVIWEWRAAFFTLLVDVILLIIAAIANG